MKILNCPKEKDKKVTFSGLNFGVGGWGHRCRTFFLPKNVICGAGRTSLSMKQVSIVQQFRISELFHWGPTLMRGQPRSFFEELSLAFVATLFSIILINICCQHSSTSSSSIFVAATIQYHPHQFFTSQLIAHLSN